MLFHGGLVPLLPRILDVLRASPQRLNVLGRELVEPPVRLLWRGLRQDKAVQELVILGVHVLVGELAVLSKNISGQVVIAVLAVQHQQIHEGLGRRRMLTQQEVEFSEALGWLIVHFDKRLVVQGDGIQLAFVSWRHVVQGVPCRLRVRHDVLDGGLEVEGLDEGRFPEHRSVAHTPGLEAAATFVEGANAQLGVVAHSSFDNLGNVLQRRPILLGAVVAQRDIVGQVGLVADRVHRLGKLLHGLGVSFLLPEERAFEDLPLLRLGRALVQEGPRELDLVLLVGDGRLKKHDPLPVVRIFDAGASLESVFVHAGLHQALNMVDLVVVNLWAHLGELAVDILGILEVLHVVITIAEQGQATPTGGEILKLVAQYLDGLDVLVLLDVLVHSFRHLALTNLRRHVALTAEVAPRPTPSYGMRRTRPTLCQNG
mmetsp:Transcript_118045/g.376383  ORF Transcript_118045/g.376383 Transcript_118045/m.376383 type:complete len:429 (-) Transcript_118045:3-1289(-)